MSWLVSLAALIVSLVALMLSREAFYLDHVPLVRVVRSSNPRAVILKNVGRGPAMAAVLVDGRDHVLANVDVVEPIGSGPSEAERLGRLQLAISDDLSEGHTYRLFYQDLRGYWHTTEVFIGSDGLRTTFRGRQSRWNVPRAVRDLRQFTTLLE